MAQKDIFGVVEPGIPSPIGGRGTGYGAGEPGIIPSGISGANVPTGDFPTLPSPVPSRELDPAFGPRNSRSYDEFRQNRRDSAFSRFGRQPFIF